MGGRLRVEYTESERVCLYSNVGYEPCRGETTVKHPKKKHKATQNLSVPHFHANFSHPFYPSSHNHGWVKNGCNSQSSYLSSTSPFSTWMVCERVMIPEKFQAVKFLGGWHFGKCIPFNSTEPMIVGETVVASWNLVSIGWWSQIIT